MFFARRLGWPPIALLAFAAVALLDAGDLLIFLEHKAADARARLLQREVESDIVIVGIDARSLVELREWPWPRSHHADLIARLADGAPRRVFFDIDFSAASNEIGDARLTAALAAWPGAPIILPAFFQQSSGSDATPLLSEPLARFAAHAELVSVNQTYGADGLVRTFRATWEEAGRRLPSVMGRLAAIAGTTDVPIDFSISPSSLTFISYADVLAGHVDPIEFRNKTVFVGATALELGDVLAVPLHKALPGVVVQALALETARQGPHRTLPPWGQVLALAALAVLAAAAAYARSWRWNLVGLIAGVGVIGAAFVQAYAAYHVALEVLPGTLVLALVFLATTVRALDEQTLRALAYALGLRRRDALLKSIVDSSTDCIVCIDARGSIRTANPAAARLFGCEARELEGACIGRFVPVLESPDSCAVPMLECDALTRSGERFPVEVSISRVNLNDERLYTAIVRDIRDRKAQQRELEYRATHDALTSLPNRTALAAHLQLVFERCRQREPFALLMLDLSRFKEVNDTLGHDVGDHVLREVGRRFGETLGADGFLARVGGDEFTAVLAPCEDARAASIAQRFSDSLRMPIDAQGVALDVGVSIGIARYPQDARDAQTLLRRADVAMYVAKRGVAPYEFYDQARDAHSVRRLAMVAKLRAAIGTPDLQLKYQPKIDLRSGRAESVEALLRWTHPTLGAIGPGEFMPLVESTDLVRPLTEWTLGEALAQAEAWRRHGLGLRVAVNLSARLLQDADFPQRLRALLTASRALPGSLEIEITESAMMLDPNRALRAIAEIASLGVPITIDDYGTGFSSLSYLRDLPVQALKLDKSFVLGLQARADNQVIVTSTVLMAHALELEVVAEGVETAWVARYLEENGCDHAQGFLYSPALPGTECLAWVRQFNAATSQSRVGSATTAEVACLRAPETPQDPVPLPAGRSGAHARADGSGAESGRTGERVRRLSGSS
jgi:diguanylate cyclase (GGDEF)-like protein/PAS domain S-box-containing protein